MSSLSIRPVTRCFPSSQNCLDESNLPFAAVLTPLAASPDQEDDAHVQALIGIAKCLHCGAPHPDTTTHFSFGSRTNSNKAALLCYLCGRVSSAVSSVQQAARAPFEGHHHHHHGASSSSGNGSMVGTAEGGETAGRPSPSTTYALPLRLASTPSSVPTTTAPRQHHTGAAPPPPPMYAIPAMACPPLWFIVLDGSCTCRLYWQAVSQVLLETLQDVPSHVHVSLLVASQPQVKTRKAAGATEKSSTLALFQLATAVPHVLHISSHADSTRQEDLLQAVVDSLVPCLPQQRPHLETAIRALMDYVPTAAYSRAADNSSHALPVAWMTQVILEAVESQAVPAGQRHVMATGGSSSSSDNTGAAATPRPYAGGKITYLLGKRPAGVSPTHKMATGPIDCGGFGGRARQVPAGGRFASNASSSGVVPVDNDNAADPTTTTTPSSTPEWTPTGLEQHYQSAEPNVELFYADLGKQCAAAALGVDLVCLVTEGTDDDDNDTTTANKVPDFGLALIQGLSEKSGAAGPLLFDISKASSPAALKDDAEMARLTADVMRRTPWQAETVFGAELRVRLSPGYMVDHQSVEFETSKPPSQPQLAAVYCEAGLVGPASPVDDSTHLWRMGCISHHQSSMTIDLALERSHVKDRCMVDGFGEVLLQPVIQTCLAYTTIVPDPARPGEYQTARRMRIASTAVPLAGTVEQLYDSVDPEALAVVLFHKLAVASFQEGLPEVSEIAGSWLRSLLVCAYRSAEDQDALLEQEAKTAPGQEINVAVTSSPYFVANERLLDREGDLPAEDVLLAQGHKKLAPIPLMVHLLLQCDPLRQQQQHQQPLSLDLRIAALFQMASMWPSNLARAIAPRLQLWAGGDDAEEPLLPIIELNATAVQEALMEYNSQTKTSKSSKNNGLLLFLDSPDQILVMDASHVMGPEQSAPAKSSLWGGKGKKTAITVGAALQQAVSEAANSYRAKPVVRYLLDENDGKEVLARLTDILVEDAPSSTGDRNFTAWRGSIAAAVNEELLDST